MPILQHKRYTTPGGIEYMVVKAAEGEVLDGNTIVVLTEAGYDTSPEGDGEKEYKIGDRLGNLVYKNDEDGKPLPPEISDGSPELLVIRNGTGNLTYKGEPLEKVPPKVLPSAD